MVSGVGLGLRRDIAQDLIELESNKPDFLEFAPENWMNFGGKWKKTLDKIVEIYPIVNHGLSLSIGSPDDLQWDFLKDLKAFFNEYPVQIYSEHLSYSKSNNAHLYDLLPIPFRQDAVDHIVKRIKTVQDFLEMPIALENVSYYTPIGAEMSESEFISTIVNESACNLLLDVNNVYVNAFNHSYDPKEFLNSIPLEKVVYIHMAGHTKINDDVIIDTHGEDIIDPVYELLSWTLPKLKPVPILLERDFNIPEMESLQKELNNLKSISEKSWNIDVKA